MLKTLYIENLAVIEQMTVNFEVGLTVFTGETGAGKSILIDAINLILGQRSTKDIIRTGTKKAIVSAVFTDLSDDILKKINEYGFDVENGEILISREVNNDGKSTARLNCRPVTVGALKEIGVHLINIHGQHDNQVLLNQENYIDILDVYAQAEEQTPNNHLDMLDKFADHTELLNEYKAEYHNYNVIKNKYRKISIDEQEKARKIDLLTFQIDEISEVNPRVSEDKLLEDRLNTMRNSENISKSLNNAYNALYGVDGEGGCYDIISKAFDSLEDVSEYNKDIESITEQLESVQYEIEEIVSKLSNILETVEFDSYELHQAELRMDDIYSLKRKYGSTVEEILEYCENAKAELDSIKMSDQIQQDLLKELNDKKKLVMSLGKKLSDSRQRASKRFSEQVKKELVFLDMPNVELKVSFNKSKYGAKGCDDVEFLFSTNKGEEPKSIGKIASGGELSRIMLAIKSVLAEKDEIPTLIFDEIDTGVSGPSAQKIGLKLKEVSKDRQVLCVTHSAQIASLANNNFLIKKQVDNERTYTKIIPLDEESKVREVARIMATDEITDLMIENARAMILSQKG